MSVDAKPFLSQVNVTGKNKPWQVKN